MSRVLSVLVLVLAVGLAGTPLCRCLAVGAVQSAAEDHGCCSTGGETQLSSARCCNGSAASLPTTATLEHPTSVTAAPVSSAVTAEVIVVLASPSTFEAPPRLAPSRTSPILRI